MMLPVAVDNIISSASSVSSGVREQKFCGWRRCIVDVTASVALLTPSTEDRPQWQRQLELTSLAEKHASILSTTYEEL